MQSFISTLIFSFLISISCFAIKGGVVLAEYDELARSVVALQMVEKDTSGKVNFYKGTAVLISENIALTASHNFFYLSESDIKLSSAILSTSPKWGYKLFNEKRISIKKVIMLPGFSQSSLGTQNDLALILLSESVPYYYRPLKMDFNPMLFHQSRELITVLGYGRSSESSTAPLEDYRLRKIDLSFARWDNSNIYNSQKFWLNQNIGAIEGGDSGGPALTKRHGYYYISGITIHRRYDECVKNGTCADQGAFTNLTFYQNWIKKTFSELKRIQ